MPTLLAACNTHLEPFNLHFQDIVQAATNLGTSKYLLRQEVTCAGFYEDGTITGSVTNAVTNELEKCRWLHLGQELKVSLNKGEYERWYFDGWKKMSTVFCRHQTSLDTSRTQSSK